MSRHLILPPDVRSWFQYVRDEEEREPRIRFEREVCPNCHGRGTVDNLGDVTEWLREDPDAIDDYMSGMYDVRCDECQGHNVVDHAIEAGSDPDDWASLMSWLRDAYEYRAEVAAERRMGA
jgi:ribosomal protein S27E